MIKEIAAEETWHLRRQVMWPEKDIGFVKLDEDADGNHFGYFSEGTLVTVVSLFIKGRKAQFRKFATSVEHQGKGYGTTLLRYMFEYLKRSDIRLVYCNARVDKAAFYEKFGMVITDKTFNKEGVNYVIMEKKLKFDEQDNQAEKKSAPKKS